MKIKLILIGIAGILLLSSANSKLTNRNDLPSEWGEWMNDDCFKGIDYRVQKGEYNSYAGKWNWYVQFRNRYQATVHYNYIVSEPGTRPDPDHRDEMAENSMSDTKLILLYNSARVHVRVGYIRFGNSYSGNYATCYK